MTTCQSIQTDLHAFVDGELQGRWRLEVERHVAECEVCAAAVRSIANLGDTLRVAATDDRFMPAFEGLASGVISRVRAESAMSWRSRLSHACDDWHWAIVGSGALAATFISTLLVSAILVFGPAPERADSLSALLANLGSPAGMLFVCGTPTGSGEDATLLQIDNGQPAASRMTAALASSTCGQVSEADLVQALSVAVTGASGRVVRLDAMHRAEREYTEALLSTIARMRVARQPQLAGREVDVHQVRLVTGLAVVAKAL